MGSQIVPFHKAHSDNMAGIPWVWGVPSPDVAAQCDPHPIHLRRNPLTSSPKRLYFVGCASIKLNKLLNYSMYIKSYPLCIDISHWYC